MQRRGFLKFALGGTIGLVASPAIWTTLYDLAYWTQNWGWIPRLKDGESTYVPTVSKLDGTPITVRVVDNRITRTLGNKENEMSKGALTPLAASEAQLLYSESRVKRPLKRGADGGYIYISWEEAEKILIEKTKEAQSSCAFLNGDTSSSLNDLYSAFLSELGSQEYYFMPTDEANANIAWHALGGSGQLGFDIANSDFIFAVGANFLDSWGKVAHNRAIYNENHPTNAEATQSIAYAGPMQNNTSVVADMWLPIKAGTEETFLFGILAELARQGKSTDTFVANLANSYSLEDITKVCGTPKELIVKVVKQLLSANRPLVIAGTTEGQTLSTTAHMLAIVINDVLGRLNKEGGIITLNYRPVLLNSSQNYDDIYARNFIDFCLSASEGNAPKLLFINEANPVYALPKSAKVVEALKKISYKICFATHWSETCAECDLILPAAHGLERFDDVFTPHGSGSTNWTLAKPVVAPLYYARPVGEVVIALAEELGLNLGINDVPSLLQIRASHVGVNFKEYIETGATFQAPLPVQYSTINTMALRTKTASIPLSEISLYIYTNFAAGKPSTGIPPYANRAITDYQLQDGYAIVQMNKVTASKLGVQKGDLIKLYNEQNTFTGKVLPYEGIAHNVIAVMAGLGHTEFDRFSVNKGENILHIAHVIAETGTNLPVWTSNIKVQKG